MVAGHPVRVQSPASNKFLIGVRSVGRHLSEPGTGENVAAFSRTTTVRVVLASRVAGIKSATSFLHRLMISCCEY
jgi:hypothetical protein